MTDKRSEDDENQPTPKSFKKYIIALFIISMVWLGIFLAFGLAEPLRRAISTFSGNLGSLLGLSQSSLAIAAAMSAYISILMLATLNPKFKMAIRTFIRNVPGASVEVSAYRELRPGEMQQLSDEEVSKAMSSMLNRIADLEDKSTSDFIASGEQANEIRDDIVRGLTEKISRETSEKYHRKVQQEVIDHLETSALRRLSDLSVVLGSRARLTLWMGVIVCGGGIYALYLSLFKTDSLLAPEVFPSNWLGFVVNYGPRFSLVILVELIGLFFLKLYKATLSEIRFVQNEITNVEMKLIALHAAGRSEPEVLASTIANLASTERNSIIDKGQTTVEIERNRAASEADKSVLDAAVSLLHGAEKASFWRSSN